MSRLVLLRHGQSRWNQANRFTGWTDVDLSELGVAEARTAGRQLAAEGLDLELAFTSVLKRAVRTLWIVLEEMDLMWLPVEGSWRLNERHYGALQGLNKAETTRRYGAEQVQQWRRSYRMAPAPLERDDQRHPRFDGRYAGLDPGELPATESLADTYARVMPFWEQAIAPRLRVGGDFLISAHGNSLRALVKHLDQIGDEEITALNIPTGIPLVYELDEELAVKGSRYLGDPEAVKAAAEAVARQAEGHAP